MKRAQEMGRVEFFPIQIRDFSQDRHRTVDDAPYGGGEGMLLRADVLYQAWKSIPQSEGTRTLLLSPQGRRLDQKKAKSWSKECRSLILVCGHYEGVDERFIEHCVDEEVSIGDYVLTGGELAALVVADTVTRLLPGVVGNPDSVTQDSLENGLKYPQYTRPRDFLGRGVPEVLLSGNHAQIAQWRAAQSLQRTREKRPDLLPSSEADA